MTDKNKGLADQQDGEFILNESGTTITTDKVEGVDTAAPQTGNKTSEDTTEESSSGPEEKDITD